MKWEYLEGRIKRGENGFQDELNGAGALGWELVCFEVVRPHGVDAHCVFKRPVPTEGRAAIQVWDAVDERLGQQGQS